MEMKEILFLLITLIIIIHETRKIKDSYYIFNVAKIVRENPKELENYSKYQSILRFDVLELIFLLLGLMTPQWYCFLAIIILSFSKIQNLGLKFFRLDAILTISIMIISIYCRFFL